MNNLNYKKIQVFISHFLKNHRKTHGLSAKGFAEQSGIGISRYRKIEGDGVSRNPLISSLEEISNLAAQLDLEAHELVYYLLNEGAPVVEDPRFGWQKSFLSALKRVNPKLLSEFTSIISASRKDKLEYTLGILTRLLKEDAKSLLKIERYLSEKK